MIFVGISHDVSYVCVELHRSRDVMLFHARKDVKNKYDNLLYKVMT